MKIKTLTQPIPSHLLCQIWNCKNQRQSPERGICIEHESPVRLNIRRKKEEK